MKVTTIFIQKSRTINTEGSLGRDAFRKITVGMEAEVDKNEKTTSARDKLSEEVDNALKQEILKIKSVQKKYTNF